MEENSEKKNGRRSVRLSDIESGRKKWISARDGCRLDRFDDEVEDADATRATGVSDSEKYGKERTGDKAGGTDGNVSEGASDCLKAALRLLAFSERSERQLRERLAEKGFSPYDIGLAISTLSEKRYLDDSRFIENYARRAAKVRLCGIARIRAELAGKVDRDPLEEHFERVMTALSEEIDFTEIALKYAKKQKNKSREAIIYRLKANGFTTAQIKGALSRLDGE